VYGAHKLVVLRELKTKYAVNMFYIKFKQWQKKKRPTREERNVLQIRNCFNGLATQIHDVCEHRSRKILKAFLMESSIVHLLKQQIITFYKHALCIQTHYKAHKMAKDLRMGVLVKVFWEREKNFLFKITMQKKTARNQALWKKLNLLDPAIRDAVLEAYMTRCLLRMKARFLEWRLDFRLSNAPD